MKKLTLFLVANLIGLGLLAEGYQINLQSTRQLGMGHLGTALKLGSESMLFNPAGMVYMNGKTDISLGANAIFSKVTYTKGAYSAKTDNPVGTPIFGYAAFKISDKLAAGISINNPVGNKLVWPENWSGAHIIQNIKLESFTIQPTLSYKLTENISIGAGLMIDFGDFELSRSLIPIGGLAPLAQAYPTLAPVINKYSTEAPVVATLEGKSKIAFGYNIGVLFTVSPKVNIGISYRSKVHMDVNEGTAALKYAGDDIKAVITQVNTAVPGTIPIPPIDKATFKATLPIPSNLNLGVSYQPTEFLLLSAELQHVGWKAYDYLYINFDNAALPDITSKKNYKNTMIYRLGGAYKFSDKFTARFGAIYDTTPIDKTLYNPETPGANKFSLTTGFSYKPTAKLSLDFAFQYLNGAKTYGSVPDPRTGNPTNTFSGDYKSIAYIPSFGVSFLF